MKKTFLLLTIFLLSIPVRAEWIYFGLGQRETPSGEVIFDKYYYDDTSIKILNANKRRVWIYGNYSLVNTFNIKSILYYEEYDCNEKSYKYLQSEVYTGFDLMGEHNKLPDSQEINYIRPDGLRNELYRILCSRKKQ